MTDMRTATKLRRCAPAVALALSLPFVWADTPWAQTAQGRVIYMATIEPRGGAQQDKEPFPQTPAPCRPKDAAGRERAMGSPHVSVVARDDCRS
jgi:hypothetical protein